MADVLIAGTEAPDFGRDDVPPNAQIFVPTTQVALGAGYQVTISGSDDHGVAALYLFKNGTLYQTFSGEGPHIIDEPGHLGPDLSINYGVQAQDTSNNVSAVFNGTVLFDGSVTPWAQALLDAVSVSTIYVRDGEDPRTVTLDNLLGGTHAFVDVVSSEPAVAKVAAQTDVNGEVVIDFVGKGVSTVRFTSGSSVFDLKIIVVDASSGSFVQSIKLADGSPESMLVNDPPILLQVVDHDGLPLPTIGEPARVSVRDGSAVNVPSEIWEGRLPVFARSVGKARIEVTYDVTDDENVVTRKTLIHEFEVLPS